MKLLRTISSLLLAALVLMASSSFYVGVHYCSGAVKAVAFLDEADGCGHQQLPPCHRKAMEGCCNDEQFIHESQDINGATVNILLPVLSSTDVIHHTQVVAEIIPTASVSPTSYFTDHPPAPTGHDIIITNQSFLI
ncbi:MAG: hypothetical protein HRU69_00850 [Flammeovirgaceae bacterium]|nr:MAG: hypothetical protein HRU69_00850 [Flammeovirgaceae bacterium]